MMNIKEAVATKIAGSGSAIMERVIDMLVEETLDKRVKQVMQAYTELDKLTREMYRIKPDVISYHADATIASEAYSKAKIEEKKKITERMTKVQKALDAALDLNDFDLLSKLGDNHGGIDPKNLGNNSAGS